VNAALVSGLLNPYGIAVSGSDLFVGLFEHDGEVGEYSTSGAPVNVSLIPDVGGIPFGIALGTGAGTAVVPLPPAAWTTLSTLVGLFTISVMRKRARVS